MASYNRIGLMETAASYPLLTEVLRGEWGFKGAVLSDMTHSGNGSVNFKCYENINNRILAGCNSQLDSGGFGGKSEAKWDSSAWNGKGAPTYTNSKGEKVISWSYWYATRQMIKGVMYMGVHSTGQYRGLTQVVDEQNYEYVAGKKFSITVDVEDRVLSDFKLNNRIELPEGVTFNDGVLSGKFKNAGLYRIDVIATDSSGEQEQTVAIKLVIQVTPGDAGGGCGGDITSVSAVIGAMALIGIGALLLSVADKKKRAR